MIPPGPPRPAKRPKTRTFGRDSNDFIYAKLRSALLMPKGHPIGEADVRDGSRPIRPTRTSCWSRPSGT